MRKKFFGVTLSVLCVGAFLLGARGGTPALAADYDHSYDQIVCAMWQVQGRADAGSEAQAIEAAGASAFGMCVAASQGDVPGCCSYDSCYVLFSTPEGGASAVCYATPFVYVY